MAVTVLAFLAYAHTIARAEWDRREWNGRETCLDSLLSVANLALVETVAEAPDETEEQLKTLIGNRVRWAVKKHLERERYDTYRGYPEQRRARCVSDTSALRLENGGPDGEPWFWEDALSVLPPVERRVIEMRYRLGYSREDIAAEVFDGNLGRYDHYRRKALATLRKKLDKKGERCK